MKNLSISTISVALLVLGGCSSYPAGQASTDGQTNSGVSKGQAMVSPPIGGMGSNTTREAEKAEAAAAAKSGSTSKGQAMVAPPIGGMGSDTTRAAVKTEAAAAVKSDTIQKGEIEKVPAK